MLQALMRAGLVYAVWRQIKPRLKAILICVTSILVVQLAHVEALNFLRMTERQSYIPWVFYLKWTGWLIIAGYFVLCERQLRKHNATTVPKNEKTDKGEITSDDGFDSLRRRGKLRTHADLIIEKHKHETSHTD